MNNTRLKHALPYIGIAALPFVLLYWLVPGLSDLTIGNDYVLYAIDEQLELQFALRHGEFPLFIPGFACGRTVAALTLGQLFHPQPHLAALLPGYFDGAALTINTLLRLLSLGGAHLALFALLKRLRLTRAIAFLLSLITVYNLRMLDLFRYGASLENYTGHLFLIAALAALYLRPVKVWGSLSVVAATYLLLCGGHPQMMYFGLLAAVVIGIAVPFILPAVDPSRKRDAQGIRCYYKTAALSMLAGLLLAAPYVLPFYTEFLSDNAVRVNRAYSWSLSNSDHWAGVLSNFVQPMNSDVHGAFGGSSLLLLVLVFPLLRARGTAIPRAVWALFGVALFALLCSMGKQTPVHYLFWKLFPMASSFRTPGRIAMLLPAVDLFLLAFVFSRQSVTRTLLGRKLHIAPAQEGALLGLLLTLVYFAVERFLPAPGRWTPPSITAVPDLARTAIPLLGALTLTTVALFGFRKNLSVRVRRSLLGMLSLFVLLQTGTVLRYGTWHKPRPKTRTFAEYQKEKQQDLRAKVVSGYGMESARITEQLKHSILETKPARFYREVFHFPDDRRVRKFLQRKRRSTQAVVVSAETVSPENRCASELSDTVTLSYSSYNKLRFSVDAKCDGLLALAFPFDSRWEALLHGKPLPVLKTNGYELGVRLPKGTHRVTFQYHGDAHRAGFGIAGLTAFFMALGLSLPLRKTSPRCFAAVLGLSAIFGAAIVVVPTLQMMDAPSFGTRYRWTSDDFPPADNLAFAKKTTMSPMRSDENPYRQYSGRAVDGDRQSRGFLTHPRYRGWWQVDLGRVAPIRTVVIYGNQKTPRPFTVSISEDGQNFQEIKTITGRPKKGKWTLDLKDSARFLRIFRPETGEFTLREVEIY